MLAKQTKMINQEMQAHTFRKVTIAWVERSALKLKFLEIF